MIKKIAQYFLSIIFCSNVAFAEISFVSSSNSSVTLFTTVANDDGGTVFVFKGLAQGENADLSFSTSSACPFVAIAGGAKFSTPWSCASGTISTSLSYQGGLSFGPATEENQGSFYVTFSNPPAPEGLTSPPEALSGIQMSLYGDISQWSLTGERTTNGVAFGIELSGTQGSEAHFLMDLPSAAVTFLGGVLGITVGGKADPFATVTTNPDGSVSIAVDIASLQSSALISGRAGVKGSKTITKKILAGERTLSIASKKSTVSSGATLNLALCAGKTFTAGEKASLSFLIGGKSSSLLKSSSVAINTSGCATKKVKLNKALRGSLVAKVTYKGQKASAKVKINS